MKSHFHRRSISDKKNKFIMKHLFKTFERGNPEWFTTLANWNICIFRVTLRHYRGKRIKLYIKALIRV